MGGTDSRIIAEVLEWNKEGTTNPAKIVLRPSFSSGNIIGTFYGAHKNGWCGGGVILNLKKDHIIKLKMGIGKGTNFAANLISLWGLLWFANMRDFLQLEVYRDSKFIIHWENAKNDMQLLGLYGWMQRTMMLFQDFHALSFKHIYIVFNTDVDAL